MSISSKKNNNILLLENREARTSFDKMKLSKYSNVLKLVSGDVECNNLLDNFLKDHSTLGKYNTIIIHSNIFYEERRDELFKELKEYCSDKNLIIFSGGTSSSSLRENILELSADKLYKENLEMFLQEYSKATSNILMLSYGKKWQLNILLNILEKINLFINDYNENTKSIYKFIQKVKLNDLNKINKTYYSDNIDGSKSKITIEEIYEIRDYIYKRIQEDQL